MAHRLDGEVNAILRDLAECQVQGEGAREEYDAIVDRVKKNLSRFSAGQAARLSFGVNLIRHQIKEANPAKRE